MSGLSSLLNTARQALSAQTYGVTVAGQNVANANTPMYARRQAILETQPVGTETYGGVKVAGLQRTTDTFLDRRYFESKSLSSGASERDRQLESIEAMFSSSVGVSLGDSLNNLLASFSSLAANPGDVTARATVLERAGSFAQRANEMGDTLGRRREELLNQAKQITQELNVRAADVASLNRQITIAKSAGQDAADLIDKRNLVLLDLSELVDVRSLEGPNGEVLVQSSGITLVEGSTARSFSVDLADDGSMRILAQKSTGPATDVSSFLSGGALAGVKEARDKDIFDVQNRLDKLLFEVGSAINAQHGAGYGLDGSTGTAVFTLPGSSGGTARAIGVNPALTTDKVAAAQSAGTLPGGSGNAVILAGMQDSGIAGLGGKSAVEGYADLVGFVGSRKSSTAEMVNIRQSVHEQIETMRESMSGVSLEEEMVNLTKYQRAYEAAAKVVSTVDELLQELLARVGR